ncbi:replication initiation protein [Lactococcus lactis]|uniref:replication initiation protein n=1 Tax=Lactococcus lactis TaxID=1358 RepID=UPI0035C6F087
MKLCLLINLKKNFTHTLCQKFLELNSKYSIILYRWLSMITISMNITSAKGDGEPDQVEGYAIPQYG